MHLASGTYFYILFIPLFKRGKKIYIAYFSCEYFCQNAWSFTCKTSMANISSLHNKNLRMTRNVSRSLCNSKMLGKLRLLHYVNALQIFPKNYFKKIMIFSMKLLRCCGIRSVPIPKPENSPYTPQLWTLNLCSLFFLMYKTKRKKMP